MRLSRSVSGRGSVELIVLGLLAALVVALAFPMLNRLDKKPVAVENGASSKNSDPLPID